MRRIVCEASKILHSSTLTEHVNKVLHGNCVGSSGSIPASTGVPLFIWFLPRVFSVQLSNCDLVEEWHSCASACLLAYIKRQNGPNLIILKLKKKKVIGEVFQNRQYQDSVFYKGVIQVKLRCLSSWPCYSQSWIPGGSTDHSCKLSRVGIGVRQKDSQMKKQRHLVAIYHSVT